MSGPHHYAQYNTGRGPAVYANQGMRIHDLNLFEGYRDDKPQVMTAGAVDPCDVRNDLSVSGALSGHG